MCRGSGWLRSGAGTVLWGRGVSPPAPGFAPGSCRKAPKAVDSWPPHFWSGRSSFHKHEPGRPNRCLNWCQTLHLSHRLNGHGLITPHLSCRCPQAMPTDMPAHLGAPVPRPCRRTCQVTPGQLSPPCPARSPRGTCPRHVLCCGSVNGFSLWFSCDFISLTLCCVIYLIICNCM